MSEHIETSAERFITLLGPSVNGYPVVLGATNDEQQAAGCVSVLPASVLKPRVQVRCLGSTLDIADQVALSVIRELGPDGIEEGPSMHYDGPETWEMLLFVTLPETATA